jgi:hypothetical protein
MYVKLYMGIDHKHYLYAKFSAPHVKEKYSHPRRPHTYHKVGEAREIRCGKLSAFHAPVMKILIKFFGRITKWKLQTSTVLCRTSRDKSWNISITHEFDIRNEHRRLFSIQPCLGLDRSVTKASGWGLGGLGLIPVMGKIIYLHRLIETSSQVILFKQSELEAHPNVEVKNA